MGAFSLRGGAGQHATPAGPKPGSSGGCSLDGPGLCRAPARPSHPNADEVSNTSFEEKVAGMEAGRSTARWTAVHGKGPGSAQKISNEVSNTSFTCNGVRARAQVTPYSPGVRVDPAVRPALGATAVPSDKPSGPVR